MKKYFTILALSFSFLGATHSHIRPDSEQGIAYKALVRHNACRNLGTHLPISSHLEPIARFYRNDESAKSVEVTRNLPRNRGTVILLESPLTPKEVGDILVDKMTSSSTELGKFLEDFFTKYENPTSYEGLKGKAALARNVHAADVQFAKKIRQEKRERHLHRKLPQDQSFYQAPKRSWAKNHKAWRGHLANSPRLVYAR